MPIKVGINENVVISEAKKNEKGTLVIKVKEANEIDPMAALSSSGSTQFNKAEKDFMIYPPTVTGYSGETDTFEGVLKKIAEVKDPLDHILEQYLIRAGIKWDPFVGTEVTKENITTKLLSQTVLDKIYSNIVDQFVKMMSPFASDNGKKMRMLFIRQSKAKHFPSFRKRFLETYPFIEPMDVPATLSKLKFSDYETKNGLGSGDVVAPGATVTQEEKNQVDALFTDN